MLDALDQLVAYYREVLAGRIESLQAAHTALRGGEQEARESIHRIAHSLYGSGATYGFEEITRLAGRVLHGPEEELNERIGELLEHLRAVHTGEAGEHAATQPLNLLVIDDDHAIFRILQERLSSKNRTLIWARSGEEAKVILRDRAISLVILDLVLPDTEGRNLLVWMRERAGTAAVPVVVLSVKASSDTKTECFALGADSFFEKPFNPGTLSAAVASLLLRSGRARRQALRDPLTELPNRAAFHEAYGRLASLSARTGEPLSIAMVDLDSFKLVNDRFGHAAGDAVLRGTAEMLKQSLRNSDLVARWGGEEFALLLPRTAPAGAGAALTKALESLREHRFTPTAEDSLRITFSAGVAAVLPGVTVADAAAEADRRLYRAKSAGKNRVVCDDLTQTVGSDIIGLIEDDTTVAMAVRAMLEADGYSVAHYPTGAAGLEALELEDLELTALVLDLLLPDTSGFDVLSAMRRLTHRRRLPVLVLTAHGSEDHVERAFETGADDFLMKPFRQRELLARLRRLVKRRG